MFKHLHCNKCFRHHKLEPNTVFHVSRCGHVVCATCLQNTWPICSKPFNGAIIDETMPRRMSDYFGDPLRLLKNFQKVTKFQYDQERQLVERLSTVNDQEDQKQRRKQMDYKKLQEILQKELDKDQNHMQIIRAYIAKHAKDGGQSSNMTVPLTARTNVSSSAGRVMSEPPVVNSFGKGELNPQHIPHYERPREQSSYMKPPIIGQTIPLYPAPKYMPNQTTEYNPHHNKIRNVTVPVSAHPGRRAMSEPPAAISFAKVELNRQHIPHYERPREQSSYMKPPIVGQTRTRYPAPKNMPNQTTGYNSHHKTLKQTPYMTPPITTDPRPRYPPSRFISDLANKPSTSSAASNAHSKN